jgi:hypothetical protein
MDNIQKSYDDKAQLGLRAADTNQQRQPIRTISEGITAVKGRLAERGTPNNVGLGDFSNATPEDPGYFSHTVSGLRASNEGMGAASGFGQTLGATVGGALRIAHGVATDANNAFVLNPLKALGRIGVDAYNGGVRPGTQAPTGALRPVQPTAPAAPIAAAPDPAPSNPQFSDARTTVPASAEQERNAVLGLPTAQQMGAADRSVSSLRSNPAPNPLQYNQQNSGLRAITGSDIEGANANIRSAVSGMRQDGTYNFGKAGGNADIYGSKDANGRLVLTGNGGPDGAAPNAAPPQTSAERIAAMERTGQLQAQVNGLRVNAARANDPTPGVSMFGNGDMMQDLRAKSGGQLISAGTAARRTAQEQIAAQRDSAAAQHEATMFGHQVQNNNNLRSYDSSMFGHNVSMQNAKSLRQFEAQKFQVEQGNKKIDQRLASDKFDEERGQHQFANKQASEKSITEQILQAHTTTDSDGKGVVDNAGANATRKGLEDMIANQINDLKRSGTPNDLKQAQLLSDNGVHALSPDMRAKGIAAVKLMAKVNAGSSNINPFKPDPLSSSDPRDYMNLKRNADGDYVTGKNQVIPNRHMAKQNADFVGGQPINEFDILKAGQ